MKQVRYCHEGRDRSARVTETNPETGAVLGIAVYDASGAIEFGVANPTPATIPEHRITHGHFWTQE